jgi:site-specific DNA-methyltransferase (adenine-specific)
MSAPNVGKLPRNQILVGDARQRLSELPDASVDCVITSPPYFGLRDYGMPEQLGAEPHIDDWVKHLVQVGQELHRVLKPTGACWINLGDCYSRHPREGASKKGLLLGPARVALAWCANGWLLRNTVVWAKRNPMPASVADRLSCAHEVIFFFTKQPTYYFDLDAIREPAITPPGSGRQGHASYPPESAVQFNGRTPRVDLNRGLQALKASGQESHPLGKNPGDVWSVATASYHRAHFATFPVELIRRPLLSTCPEKLCGACGIPWARARQAIDGRLLATGPLRPACRCGGESRRGVVLDPFMGSGTVALAAEQYGRDWLGIELNPEYAQLAEQRLAAWRAEHPDTKENNTNPSGENDHGKTTTSTPRR